MAMKWVTVGSSASKRWQIKFMPWTMFRLRLCDVSCKLSFGVWRLLMITLALGKEFAQKPSCCRQTLKQQKAHFHTYLCSAG